MNRDACCEHGLNWHHESRGCGYHGFSDDRCPCLLTFSAALDRHDAVVAAAAAETARDEGVAEGIRLAARLLKDHAAGWPEDLLERTCAFLIARSAPSLRAAAAHPDEEYQP